MARKSPAGMMGAALKNGREALKGNREVLNDDRWECVKGCQAGVKGR